ncbi:CMGC/CDK protein kinase [Coprinopsis sp. MPI-PUGE-AT-0042]|nr:CMGC/CDK protein kinase [Coprinopsis sp. MPI-PUGE-AT-0042]
MIKEGPASTVARAWLSMKDGEPQWIVVKSASIVRKFSKEPHDIRKELRLMSGLSHRNVIPILGSYEDHEDESLKIYMPYVPTSLADLLASPHFSPHPFPPQRDPDDVASRLQEARFVTVARSIIFQVLCALAYLHDESRLIAHRDVKPENILLTKNGCVKLIDFGVSWKEKESQHAKQHDLWPEHQGKLYFEVCTGAYRAPELLFGSRAYDAIALDLWSLGSTIAGFFTALRLVSDDCDDGDDDDHYNYGHRNGAASDHVSSSGGLEAAASDSSDTSNPAFVIPGYLRVGYPGAQWHRDTLFNGDRGEIGLAWSIFKIYGTPTADNWPEFNDLPGAQSVVFNQVPAVPVEPLLPNLPPSSRSPLASQTSTHPASDPTRKPSPFDLLSRFLVYPSASRQTAREALKHPWFTAERGILLPEGYEVDGAVGGQADPGLGAQLQKLAAYEWRGKSLGEWIQSMLLDIPGLAANGTR